MVKPSFYISTRQLQEKLMQQPKLLSKKYGFGKNSEKQIISNYNNFTSIAKNKKYLYTLNDILHIV